MSASLQNLRVELLKLKLGVGYEKLAMPSIESVDGAIVWMVVP